MKRTLLALILLSLLALPVAAQDDTACEIDLTSTVALLVQAQGYAASGDTERALAQIALARAKLDAFEAVCATAVVVVPSTPVELVLTQTHTIEEEGGGSLSFSYPEGWALDEDSGGVMVASAPDILEREFGSDPPPMFAGEVMIFVTAGDVRSFGGEEGDSPVALMEMLTEDVPAEFGEITQPVGLTVNDRRAATFTVVGEQTELMLMAVELGMAGDDTVYGQLILLAAPGELNAYEPTLQAVAESLELGR